MSSLLSSAHEAWLYLLLTVWFLCLKVSPGLLSRKYSSCSTIFLDDNTVSQPNLKNTIKWWETLKVSDKNQHPIHICPYFLITAGHFIGRCCRDYPLWTVCDYLLHEITHIYLSFPPFSIFSVTLAIYYHIKNRWVHVFKANPNWIPVDCAVKSVNRCFSCSVGTRTDRWTSLMKSYALYPWVKSSFRSHKSIFAP